MDAVDMTTEERQEILERQNKNFHEPEGPFPVVPVVGLPIEPCISGKSNWSESSVNMVVCSVMYDA